MNLKANGKLMLFGEYLVMRGSQCLAFPLKFNQQADITFNHSESYNWIGRERGDEWFHAIFNKDLKIIQTSDSEKAELIRKILKFIFNKNPELFRNGIDFIFDTSFYLEWGLGSSSTLVSLLSQWSGVDPYELLDNSFGGSGYDVACATSKWPIIYGVKNRVIKTVSLSPDVTENLLFVYTGKKQNTQRETKRFFNLAVQQNSVDNMNGIIEQSLLAPNIEKFEECMNESEDLLSEILRKKKIKDEKFQGYPWAIKSLGAWGGDFCLASFRNIIEALEYFNNRGFNVCFSYKEMAYHE